MRLIGATGAARGWWWIFGACIGAPAVVLAVLGLRTVQLERIERKQQVQEQQGQTALLVDAAIAAALAEHGPHRGVAPPKAPPTPLSTPATSWTASRAAPSATATSRPAGHDLYSIISRWGQEQGCVKNQLSLW